MWTAITPLETEKGLYDDWDARFSAGSSKEWSTPLRVERSTIGLMGLW